MAYHHSPRIITNGLVLALDAANQKSYPGSGTTWSDLSGNGNNGTLINPSDISLTTDNAGMLVATDFGGEIRITKTNSLDFTPTDSFTLSISGFVTDLISDGRGSFLGRGSTSTSVGIGINKSGSTFSFPMGSRAVNSLTISGTPTVTSGQRVILTFVYTPITQFGYFNGELYGSQNTESGVGGIFQNTYYSILGSRAVPGGGSRTSTGGVSTVHMYNRALSPEEVLQNFNATKGRYGL